MVAGLFSLLFWGLFLYFLVTRFTGRNKKYHHWLSRELPGWETKGIINSQQGDQILNLYSVKRGYAKKFDVVKAVTLLGAVFVGAGVIFFIASNWRDIPAAYKTILLLGITVATLYAGYFLGFEVKRYPLLGQSLLFLSTLFWGGSIILLAQIYHLPVSQNWFILWLWAFPILPLAVFLRNEYIHVLASGLFLVWNFLYSADNVLANYYYPAIVYLILLPSAKEFRLSRGINIVGLVLACGYCMFNKYEYLALLIAIGFLVYYLLERQNRLYLCASSLSFICWTITWFSIREMQPNVLFLIPLAALFLLTYRDKMLENVVLLLVGTFIWADLSVYAFARLFDRQVPASYFVLQIFLAMVVYILGMLSEKKEALFIEVYKFFGYVVMALMIYTLTFPDCLKAMASGKNEVLFITNIIMAIAVAGYLLWALVRGQLKPKPARIEALGLTVTLAGCLVIVANPSAVEMNTFVMNAVLVIFALLNIFFALERRDPLIFNFGIGIFVLFIITRFIDLAWGLRQKSLFFIVGGMLLIAAGTMLEKQRRQFIERMKKA
jgi:uncharacterized membrane protein